MFGITFPLSSVLCSKSSFIGMVSGPPAMLTSICWAFSKWPMPFLKHRIPHEVWYSRCQRQAELKDYLTCGTPVCAFSVVATFFCNNKSHRACDQLPISCTLCTSHQLIFSPAWPATSVVSQCALHCTLWIRICVSCCPSACWKQGLVLDPEQ